MLNLKPIFVELAPGSTKRIELVSGRRPRLVSGSDVKQLADEMLHDEVVLDICRAHGGPRELDELGDKPIRWVITGPKGPISVTVSMKGREVSAVFVAAAEPRRSTRPPRRASAEREPVRPEQRRSITVSDRRRVTQKPPAHGAAPAGRATNRAPTPAPARRRSIPATVAKEPAAVAKEPAAVAKEPAAVAKEPVREPRARAQATADPVLRDLCELADRQRATDIHLTPGRPAGFRIGGTLREGKTILRQADIERILHSVMPARNAAELARSGGTCFAVSVSSSVRLRVNATQTHAGTKLALRMVRSQPPSLDSLGLPKDVESATTQPQGLVLVAGPAGAGKTTTLAALVDHVNGSRPVHVVLVEDPVEILIESRVAVVSQREVGSHTTSFHRALEGALRQDPDVVAVGDLRDVETVRMALSASETGHLVIATMNAPNARRAIERIIDVFPVAEQPQVRATLAGGLRLVVGQRLLPCADGVDRVAAVEILPGSVALWNLIRDDKTFQLPSLMQRGKALGIVRLEDSIKALRDKGVISQATAEEALEDIDGASELARVEAAAPEQPGPPPEAGAEGSSIGTLWSRAGALWSRKGGT
jgi:twitching motility protein PilT